MSTPTKLGRNRQLSPRAAIHVSPLALGSMTFGDKAVAVGMAAMDKNSCFKLLDAFFDTGGNHIDTANWYQFGDSERCIGDWADARGCCDQLVIATKQSKPLTKASPQYTFPWSIKDETIKQHELFLGNNAKSTRLSVEASLKKLKTTYINIFYVHFWDLHTSVEEMMDSLHILHILVLSGQVLYLVAYSVLQRDIEREILSMCRHEGIVLTFFRVLGGGKLSTDAEEERRRASGENGRAVHGPWERTEDKKKMCTALEVVAQQSGNNPAVAIAYTMAKAPFVHPIIGGRTPEQLMANLEALDITLTDEHLAYIDCILPFDKGFPTNFVAYPTVLTRLHRYRIVVASHSEWELSQCNLFQSAESEPWFGIFPSSSFQHSGPAPNSAVASCQISVAVFRLVVSLPRSQFFRPGGNLFSLAGDLSEFNSR
ncbi:NADP-dependent oxidoreductase domain-containing protein [Mycena leptocephala]|nr:NADP-dependent oxidoreductase domain-containing protein [Mycena leptocephala]